MGKPDRRVVVHQCWMQMADLDHGVMFVAMMAMPLHGPCKGRVESFFSTRHHMSKRGVV